MCASLLVISVVSVVSVLAAALLGSLWVIKTWRQPPLAKPNPPGFVFSAATRVRAHATTNLELSIPYPPNFHGEVQPTIMRDFGPKRAHR